MSSKKNSRYFFRKRRQINYADLPETDGDDMIITISQVNKKAPVTVDEPLTLTNLAPAPPNQMLPERPFEVHTFADLLRLSRLMVSENKMFKDCQKLPTVHPILEELNAMVGIRSAKDALAIVVCCELQGLNLKYRNMVFTGNPGVGKSQLCEIVAKLFHQLRGGTNDACTKGTIFNMISQFDGGGTAQLVHKLVQKALDNSGVLWIDETQQLNDNRRMMGYPDHFGKRCIDALMNLMTIHKDKLTVIFTGYRRHIERNILQANPGMPRRIQWYIHIDDYSPAELHQIFLLKVREAGWVLDAETKFDQAWFEAHHADFPNFGGSIVSLLQKVQGAQTLETFGLADKQRLTDATLARGFELYERYILQPRAHEKARYELEQRQDERIRYGSVAVKRIPLSS